MLASINGMNLFYSEYGKAESRSIVLVHGFPFSSQMWDGQIQILLERNLRVITYDLRGHGKSDVGDGQYTIELFVDDLISLLDYLKIEKTILCGFSMGGYIALRAIERNPERFTALVLCDTTSVSDLDETKIRRARSISSIKSDGVGRYAEGFLKAVFAPQTFTAQPNIVQKTKSIIHSNDPIGICGALLAMAGRTDTTESLSKIGIPTLILVGELDTVTPPSAAQNMHQRILNSKLHHIESAGHMTNLENQIKFNARLGGFVDEIMI